MTPKPMPKTIRIGHMKWAVRDDRDAWEKVGLVRADHDGACVQRHALIAVNTDWDLPVQRMVLLHEVLHACLFMAGAAEEKEKHTEEAWVQRAAPILLDTMLRNPVLTAFLLDEAT